MEWCHLAKEYALVCIVQVDTNLVETRGQFARDAQHVVQRGGTFGGHVVSKLSSELHIDRCESLVKYRLTMIIKAI